MMLKRRTLLLITHLSVLCFSAANTRADPYVLVNINGIKMTVTNTSGDHAGEIGFWISPTLNAYTMDPDDTTEISGYDFALSMDLTFEDTGGNWSATGDISLGDVSETRIVGGFVSTDIGISSNTLAIEGILGLTGINESILVPSLDPWIYTGEYGPANGGADSSVTTVRILSNVSSYDYGSLRMEYDLLSLADVSTLGNLFASDTTRKLDYGDMELTVVVPVPPAVLLGMIGLGLAGVRLRRSSKEPHGKQ